MAPLMRCAVPPLAQECGARGRFWRTAARCAAFLGTEGAKRSAAILGVKGAVSTQLPCCRTRVLR